MFVLKNNIEIIPRNFTFILTAHFVWCIIYTYRLVGWLFDTKKEMKKERAVYPARFISIIYSLSFARRIQTPAASIGAREEQVSRPALFFCKTTDRPLFYSTHSIFFQYYSRNRSEFLVPNYVPLYRNIWLQSGCSSMVHNTAYWCSMQCKGLKQL